ncbi:MAG: cobyrinate a,c-diamide synthase [Rhodospirillales bacterium]|nr:cobyrinate a,c-diamide synthase [Rhodospirillales bacterium]
MAHVLISAAHKSSGKTTVTIGLAAALAGQGLNVQTFKKGPDYIDPMWLSRATRQPCRNLDYYTMSNSEILASFSQHAHEVDFSLIEGNKGLYDGLDLDGGNSNAALATLLGAPVILVIDASGMTRGIAPLILGYQAFDPALNIAGIILNKVGGPRHEGKLRAIIEHFTNVPVLGAVHRDERLEIAERHLGLTPSNEAPEADSKIAAIAELVGSQVDLEAIKKIAGDASEPAIAAVARKNTHDADVIIGVARDAAFGFYYPGDLEALEGAGAKLLNIDMIKDSALPEIDGLFIGGGFPETRMADLEANGSMRNAVAHAIEGGLPTYAECGGLMYLARSISWNGERHSMAGVIQGDIVMHKTPQGRGYVRLRETGKGPWPLADAEGKAGEIPAHEFHYSSIENLDAEPVFAYQVLRGHGFDGKHDGLTHRNLLASYAHLRDVEANRWAGRFINFVRSCKNTKGQS